MNVSAAASSRSGMSSRWIGQRRKTPASAGEDVIQVVGSDRFRHRALASPCSSSGLVPEEALPAFRSTCVASTASWRDAIRHYGGYKGVCAPSASRPASEHFRSAATIGRAAILLE